MHQMKYLVAVALFLCIRPAFADMFNIQLSNNSGRFSYSTEVFGGQYGPLDLETGLFFNQDSDKMVHVGMMIRNDTLDNPLVISIGTRAYYGDVGHANGQIRAKFTAIAIGGELLFIPDSLGGLGFGAYYYTAPSVVTFMDANGFSEYGLRLNYEITKQSSVSLGYQKIKLDLNNNFSETIDSSVFFGIGLRF
jgi:hypothetical protein